MVALPCLFACVVAHAPEFQPAVTPAPTVQFTLRSEWFAESFAIRPVRPDADDVIVFTDPWGNRGGGNRCIARAFWGKPSIEVDHDLHLITVEFTGGEFQTPVSAVCQAIVEDARGLAGQFGVLEPGRWEYRAGDMPPQSFIVVPEPTTLVLTLFGGAIFLQRRHRLGLRQ